MVPFGNAYFSAALQRVAPLLHPPALRCNPFSQVPFGNAYFNTTKCGQREYDRGQVRRSAPLLSTTCTSLPIIRAVTLPFFLSGGIVRSAATTRCAAGASQRQVSAVPVQMWQW